MANNINEAFKGKKILFLDGSNNLYHLGIIQSLKDMGAFVSSRVYQDYRNNNFVIKLYRKILNKKGRIDIDKLLLSLENNYDLIFVKNPELADGDFFIKLRGLNPNARFINYNWNSLKISNYLPFIKYFDKVITFDPQDAIENKLNYYPLFYLTDFEKIAIGQMSWKYDVSFVGSAFSVERRNFIRIFIERLEDYRLTYNIYLLVRSKRNYIKYKYLSPKSVLTSTYGFKYVSKNKLLKIVSNSKSFVDYKRPFQSGHDMRTFETLAAGQMLITNDTKIKECDFYDPARIIIIDEKNSDFDLLPLENYIPSFPSGFEKYRIDNWLRNILTD